MRNVVLTGFMGSGKSTVGRLLAERLGYAYCDLDEYIVTETGSSVNELFARYGEPHFRQMEHEAVRKVAAGSRQVIATGGGAVINPENRRLMHECGMVVNLQASVQAICSRLRHATDRPLLKADNSLEKVAAMLAEREQYYADADIRIDTTGKKVEDIVAEILRFLEGAV